MRSKQFIHDISLFYLVEFRNIHTGCKHLLYYKQWKIHLSALPPSVLHHFKG